MTWRWGASLSDPNNRPVLTGSGAATTIVAGTGTITVPNGSNFGQVIASSVLNKNVALDYLQAVATSGEKAEARAILTVTSGERCRERAIGFSICWNRTHQWSCSVHVRFDRYECVQ